MLNDWPPDTARPTSCPAISEMNRHRSANRVNWDSAKTGPSKHDSTCHTHHKDVNQNSQIFWSWNNSFWDAGKKVTCISILTLTTITDLCSYNIHEPTNPFNKIKFIQIFISYMLWHPGGATCWRFGSHTIEETTICHKLYFIKYICWLMY